MTKADLKRRLTVGTKLVLTNCLMGPCWKPRTVAEVRTRDYVMLTPEGKNSYLAITPEEEIRETPKGFQVVLKAQAATPGMPAQPERIAAEYVWDTPTAEYYRLLSSSAAYSKLPTTATPQAFLAGEGNWGLTESEYTEAKRLAILIVQGGN